MDCIFCTMEKFVLENDLAYAIFDKYPVNQGHLLIIPKRHAANYFDLTEEERLAIDDLLFQSKQFLDETYQPEATTSALTAAKPPAKRFSMSIYTSSQDIKET
jgi:diadenosine tetraphosphate (Ap4A) HIT family hydrolase